MIVYHGSTIEVNNPDMQHSYRNLDFGKGFYVTTVREQAERWAKRKADLSGDGNGVISVYETCDQIAFVSQDAIDRGIQYLDYRNLVQILIETEPELFVQQ